MKKLITFFSKLFTKKELRNESSNETQSDDFQLKSKNSQVLPNGHLNIEFRGPDYENHHHYTFAILFHLNNIELEQVRSLSFNIFIQFEGRINIDFDCWNSCLNANTVVTPSLSRGYSNVYVDLPNGLNIDYEDSLNSAPDQVTVDLAASNPRAKDKILVCSSEEIHIFDGVITIENGLEIRLTDDHYLKRSCSWVDPNLPRI